MNSLWKMKIQIQFGISCTTKLILYTQVLVCACVRVRVLSLFEQSGRCESRENQFPPVWKCTNGNVNMNFIVAQIKRMHKWCWRTKHFKRIIPVAMVICAFLRDFHISSHVFERLIAVVPFCYGKINVNFIWLSTYTMNYNCCYLFSMGSYGLIKY